MHDATGEYEIVDHGVCAHCDMKIYKRMYEKGYRWVHNWDDRDTCYKRTVAEPKSYLPHPT